MKNIIEGFVDKTRIEEKSMQFRDTSGLKDHKSRKSKQTSEPEMFVYVFVTGITH